jgi:hypothetical protein
MSRCVDIAASSTPRVFTFSSRCRDHRVLAMLGESVLLVTPSNMYANLAMNLEVACIASTRAARSTVAEIEIADFSREMFTNVFLSHRWVCAE